MLHYVKIKLTCSLSITKKYWKKFSNNEPKISEIEM